MPRNLALETRRTPRRVRAGYETICLVTSLGKVWGYGEILSPVCPIIVSLSALICQCFRIWSVGLLIVVGTALKKALHRQSLFREIWGTKHVKSRGRWPPQMCTFIPYAIWQYDFVPQYGSCDVDVRIQGKHTYKLMLFTSCIHKN